VSVAPANASISIGDCEPVGRQAGVNWNGQILLNFSISVEYFNFDAKKIDEDYYNYQTISSVAYNKPRYF